MDGKQHLELHDVIIATILHMGTSCGQDNSKAHLEKGVKNNQPTTGTKIYYAVHEFMSSFQIEVIQLLYSSVVFSSKVNWCYYFFYS